MSDFIPAEAFPPSEYIRDECKERGWNALDLARKSGLTPSDAADVFVGIKDIDARISAALGRAFEQDAQTWLNLQAAWDRWKAAQAK